MSERTALGATMETMILEEPGAEQASPRAPGPLRCGPCAVWPRQQTWLCVVPLMMGFVGLGLSLMLLKWIVVGSVQDYIPTDLVDANRIGQDPIFLSKPSALPKGPNGSTSAISVAPSAAPSLATRAAEGTGTVQRTRFGQSSNHTASSSSSSGGGGGALGGSSGNRAPHLHNRVGTRVTNTTTRATSLDPPGGKEVTPRSTTVQKPNGEGGSRNASPSARAGPPSMTTSKTMTISTTGTTTTQAAQPTSTIASPSKPSQRWNHGRSSKSPSTKPTRPHHRFRTLAPTTSTVRSEFFKPCQDSQEMAFCLNEGECFIIETVAGVHRHCRCKEGYRGLRCDQFVPKTDSILSDPTADELGIEFMESGETYQRQILSIFSIAVGISLLGVACMALYCKNKRQREKHRAHLTEIRNLTDVHVPMCLMSKSSPRTESALQLKKSRRAHGSSTQQASGVVLSSSKVSLPNHNRSLSMGKHCRSCSLSSSPSLKQKVTNYRAVSKWTPPISRAGYHLSAGSRDSSHSYKHLQEVEMMPESLRRTNMTGPKRTWQLVKIKYKNILQTAVKKKACVSGTGGGPPSPEFTPAEELALDINKGRPVLEGIQGGTATDSVPPMETSPFIHGTLFHYCICNVIKHFCRYGLTDIVLQYLPTHFLLWSYPRITLIQVKELLQQTMRRLCQ
ncbi:pro-neuregulin-3, membrane-bound isoform-like isoform X3 [Xyrauchen texanus]|uniref:pro-neuregulin-3, membrane-bound isoform-like isoform X3 n=1 Tax=Xyrauchen texanus TaxID=154827 RepID=UPI002241A1C4|nr:pro-neuregulin-3, membrane-bound isoform-like isoform X3 [Xyrauchen texanus]